MPVSALAGIGPLLPSDRSLPVLVGGGYVLGDFLYTVFMGTGALQIESIRRRRVGVDSSFVDVGGWFGMGPVLVAAVLWVTVGKHRWSSEDLATEDDGAEEIGRSYGLHLAGAYLFTWCGLDVLPAGWHGLLGAIGKLL
jgi:hypothetical protein